MKKSGTHRTIFSPTYFTAFLPPLSPCAFPQQKPGGLVPLQETWGDPDHLPSWHESPWVLPSVSPTETSIPGLPREAGVSASHWRHGHPHQTWTGGGHRRQVEGEGDGGHQCCQSCKDASWIWGEWQLWPVLDYQTSTYLIQITSQMLSTKDICGVYLV